MPLVAAALLLLAVAGSMGVYLSGINQGAEPDLSETEPTEITHVAEDSAYARSDTVAAEPESETVVVSGRIRRNEVFSDALQRHGIPRQRLLRVIPREHVLLIDLGPFRDEAQVDEWITSHRLAQAEILLEAPFHQREILPYQAPPKR